MRIAITGATGFVGSHLTNRLESEGHELVLIARGSRKDDVRLVVSDLSDVNVLTESFEGCNVVAHCAGIKIPLTSLAQIRILSEGVVEPDSPVVPVPYDLVPTRRFTSDQIRNGLPQPGPFCVGDLRSCS